MFPCRIGLLALLGAAAIVLPHSLHAENVALGKTATVTSGAGGHYLTDGLSTTNSRWLADYGYPQTAEVDLGGTYTINSVIFKQDAERTDGYQVQVRTGGSWVTVGTGTGNTAVNITVNFTPVAADRVRFIVTSGEYYLKVYELEVMAGGGGGDTQAPSTPTGVAATPVGPDRIDLTWNAATDNVGVTGYRIYRNGIQVGTSATTSFFDTGLSPSTNYTYRVAAYDAADNLGNQSSPVSATTGAGGSTNVALGCPVTVSSGVGASFLTDGLYTSNSRWFADYGYPQWAEVDLGTQYVVHQVVFAQDLERVTDYEVQIWNGLAWDVVATGTNNSALTITADFVPVVTDKVRFRVTSGEYYLRVFELEVYGEAGGGFATIVENITPSDAWPSQMEIATADPALSGNAVTVNGSTIASQTITPTSPFNLGSISFKYSTSVTSATNAFTVRIQEVPGGASAQTYSAGTDLFGATPITFGLASTGGQTRILRIDLGGSLQIPLAAGTTYAVEILSNGPAMTLYRRGADSYSGGLLYTNRSAFNYPSTRDLAMALGEAGQDLPDSDGDGMDNAWEIANGLDPNNAADASEDPDGDGLTNLQEYLAGTDPNVPNGGSNVVTASVQSANAYELENGYAAVRFNRTGGTNAITVNFSRSGAAGTSDYTVRDSSGNALNGSVTIPAGASSVTLWIDPTADALNEYPETATITIESGSGYTVGAQASASVTINDATDIPANEKLFVASLLPPSGVSSSASGVGVIYLNGPKTVARVSLNFSGLSSTQTNSYIRYGGTGQELRPNMGTGQLSNVIWNITQQGNITPQQIINALFQTGGAYVYVNVGTTNYPSGEIQGTWKLEEAGGVYPPPAPPPITPLDGAELRRDVARFLSQATFGPTAAEIDALVNTINTTYGGDRIAAFSAWIDQQLALDQSKMEIYAKAEDRRRWTMMGLDVTGGSSPVYPPSSGTLWAWWLHCAKGHDQLRQRFGYAASEIFVISKNSQNFLLSQQRYGTSNYYDMLGSYASGNFRDMLESVSKHPVMGQYLSSLQNQKAVLDAQGNQIVSPDENYAREVMQLFSIGLVQLRLDGAVQTSGGMPIATYNNQDIQNLARVFTGWSFSKTPGPPPDYAPVDNTNFNLSINSAFQTFFNYAWTHPMKNFSQYHDTGSKVVLGTTIPAGLNGEADLDAALDILFNHPSTPAFISRAFIQFLVTSNPSPGYVYRVASKFVDNGNGVRGDMKAVLKAILLDYEARDLGVAAGVTFGKQKEPILRAVQIVRAFQANCKVPLSNLSPYGYPASQLNNFPAGTSHLLFGETNKPLGQTPQLAPSVFNWFRPDYAPNGPLTAAGLVAPEMQMVTESRVISVINYLREMVRRSTFDTSSDMYGITVPTDQDITLAIDPLVAAYDDAISSGQNVTNATAAAVDYLDDLLSCGNLKAVYGSAPTPNPRSILIDGVASMNTSTTTERMRELLYLFINSPEFTHQK